MTVCLAIWTMCPGRPAAGPPPGTVSSSGPRTATRTGYRWRPPAPSRERPLRVLHVGNIANNGYLNAKLMRRIGVEADALCDEWHILSQPEWEDAEIDGASHAYEWLAGPA